MKRAAVHAGERITIEGEEKEHAFAGETTASLRAAPTKTLASVSADVITVGDDVEPRKEPRKDEAPTKRRERKKPRNLLAHVTAPRILSFAGLALLLLSTTMRVSPGFVDAIVIAITLHAVALTIAAWRSLPRFVRGHAAVEEQSREMMAYAVVGGIFLCAPFAFALIDFRWAWLPAVKGESNAAWLVAIGAMLYHVLLGVLFVRCSRKRASLLHALLDAPPFAAMPDETKWGSVEGVVRDPTPVEVGGAERAVATVVKREVRGGSDPDIVTESVLNQGTFFVDAGVGTFELDPTSATWASAVRMVTTDTEKKHTFADVVVIGGRILVAGRAVTPAKGEPARFLAGRAESLVFYATGRDIDARARARSVAWRRATIGGLAFGVVAIGALLAVYGPQLPAMHFEASGDF